ncbi:DUF5522 domain-containing protein [Acidipila sp. EB88]|uniref:DUF5522 domain-containing protein n=1 Tax=Acidipila sp. EB88 TaxID=2305226 RepID=UPI000F6031C0|nr:DUF5522 domain-containing protein [Acidipila sp. EB88]RRA48613.1 hypothetical protein D1Y84_10250 [Acidipila sp. EB88]
MSDNEAGEQDPDYYMDGPFCVFTATFHLKRGFCCGSGCRHCPYDEEGQPLPEASPQRDGD